ncbi:rhodanese-like domain-containing protein [Shewanella algae]|nr:rhodanese-like domain-containing protein [Shewanella algae]MBO2552999.1 rhodanese-like domain-containing protein [Shewanella algae]MBO2561497.1 rhodanese-like domain-containing protein [Shewanella algae]MBO2578503.1 rhodanese-like domain-containing protein [Shewanella algae]MBO2582905.1 rhodanese-like domain-containing protein [Shewanella algae]
MQVKIITRTQRQFLWLTTLLFAVLLSLSVRAEQMVPEVALTKVAQGAMLVDVRTPEEYAEGHLPEAVNIPFEQIAEAFAKQGIAKDTPVVVYCRSGRRSGIAKESLEKAGYQEVYNGGGYDSLKASAGN